MRHCFALTRVFFFSLMENEQRHLGGNEQVTAREKGVRLPFPLFF